MSQYWKYKIFLNHEGYHGYHTSNVQTSAYYTESESEKKNLTEFSNVALTGHILSETTRQIYFNMC